jgi:hypothetical protein
VVSDGTSVTQTAFDTFTLLPGTYAVTFVGYTSTTSTLGTFAFQLNGAPLAIPQETLAVAGAPFYLEGTLTAAGTTTLRVVNTNDGPINLTAPAASINIQRLF